MDPKIAATKPSKAALIEKLQAENLQLKLKADTALEAVEVHIRLYSVILAENISLKAKIKSLEQPVTPPKPAAPLFSQVLGESEEEVPENQPVSSQENSHSEAFLPPNNDNLSDEDSITTEERETEKEQNPAETDLAAPQAEPKAAQASQDLDDLCSQVPNRRPIFQSLPSADDTNQNIDERDLNDEPKQMDLDEPDTHQQANDQLENESSTNQGDNNEHPASAERSVDLADLCTYVDPTQHGESTPEVQEPEVQASPRQVLLTEVKKLAPPGTPLARQLLDILTEKPVVPPPSAPSIQIAPRILPPKRLSPVRHPPFLTSTHASSGHATPAAPELVHNQQHPEGQVIQFVPALAGPPTNQLQQQQLQFSSLASTHEPQNQVLPRPVMRPQFQLQKGPRVPLTTTKPRLPLQPVANPPSHDPPPGVVQPPKPVVTEPKAGHVLAQEIEQQIQSIYALKASKQNGYTPKDDHPPTPAVPQLNNQHSRPFQQRLGQVPRQRPLTFEEPGEERGDKRKRDDQSEGDVPPEKRPHLQNQMQLENQNQQQGPVNPPQATPQKVGLRPTTFLRAPTPAVVEQPPVNPGVPHVQITGWSGSEESKEALGQKITALGGVLITSAIFQLEVLTHIIHDTRTMKTLAGHLHGFWILSSQWVEDCYRAQKWIPEALYGVKGKGSPCEGWKVCVSPKFPKNTYNELRHLIKLGKGVPVVNRDQAQLTISQASPLSGAVLSGMELDMQEFFHWIETWQLPDRTKFLDLTDAT